VPGLLDPPPLHLAQATWRLRELRARGRQLALLAGGLALLGLVTGLLEGLSGPSIPLLIGAGAALGMAMVCRSDRRRLLVGLVSQDDAWSVEGVREFAERLVGDRERLRLTRGLRDAVAAARDGVQTPMMIRPERASAAAERLTRLAEALADPAVRVSAPAAALCRRLLSDAIHSPLYNPYVPEGDLLRVLDLVERGLAR
jgi:hypothetical protein